MPKYQKETDVLDETGHLVRKRFDFYSETEGTVWGFYWDPDYADMDYVDGS